MGIGCSGPHNGQVLPMLSDKSLLQRESAIAELVKGPDDNVSADELLSIYKMITCVVADRQIPLGLDGSKRAVSHVSAAEKYYSEKFASARRSTSRRHTDVFANAIFLPPVKGET